MSEPTNLLLPEVSQVVRQVTWYRWNAHGRHTGPVLVKYRLLPGLNPIGCGLCSVSSINVRPRNYQHFVEEMAWESLENPAKDLIGGMLPGSTEFVDWANSTLIKNRRNGFTSFPAGRT